MNHNTSGSNWGNNATGTTFTAVNAPTLESLSAGADGSAKQQNKKQHMINF